MPAFNALSSSSGACASLSARISLGSCAVNGVLTHVAMNHIPLGRFLGLL